MEGKAIDLKETQRTYQPIASISPHLHLDLSKRIVFSKAMFNIYWTVGNLTLSGYSVVLIILFIYFC